MNGTARTAGTVNGHTGNGQRLSRREREVLVELCRGLRNHQIARELFISEETVRTHLKAILRKLEARDRSEAVAIALRSGLVN